MSENKFAFECPNSEHKIWTHVISIDLNMFWTHFNCVDGSFQDYIMVSKLEIRKWSGNQTFFLAPSTSRWSMFWWCTSFQAAKKVRAHGIGVHKPEEIEEFGHNDLTVLSDLLGDKQFFFGDNPSTVSIYIFVQFCVGRVCMCQRIEIYSISVKMVNTFHWASLYKFKHEAT